MLLTERGLILKHVENGHTTYLAVARPEAVTLDVFGITRARLKKDGSVEILPCGTTIPRLTTSELLHVFYHVALWSEGRLPLSMTPDGIERKLNFDPAKVFKLGAGAVSQLSSYMILPGHKRSGHPRRVYRKSLEALMRRSTDYPGPINVAESLARKRQRPEKDRLHEISGFVPHVGNIEIRHTANGERWYFEFITGRGEVVNENPLWTAEQLVSMAAQVFGAAIIVMPKSGESRMQKMAKAPGDFSERLDEYCESEYWCPFFIDALNDPSELKGKPEWETQSRLMEHFVKQLTIPINWGNEIGDTEFRRSVERRLILSYSYVPSSGLPRGIEDIRQAVEQLLSSNPEKFGNLGQLLFASLDLSNF